jgi:hypothetical protein
LTSVQKSVCQRNLDTRERQRRGSFDRHLSQSERRIAEQRALPLRCKKEDMNAEAEIVLGELERLLDTQLARRSAIVRAIDSSSHNGK